jgi:hypothetical protein
MHGFVLIIILFPCYVISMGLYLLWVLTGHPVPEGYKYGDLSLQVGEVSNETVNYCREFCWTWIRE